MRFDNKDLGIFSNEAPKKKKRRIKITEEQYNRLFNLVEQIELRNVVEPSDETGHYERELNQSVKIKVDAAEKSRIKQKLNEKGLDDSDDSIDFIIDIASAALDVVPGIGNAASFVVDVLHSISYFIRANNTNVDVDKISHYAGGFITAAFAFVPYGGNAASMVAKQGIKPFIKLVMTSGKQHAIRLGLKKGIYLLKWKFPLLVFLIKLFGEDLKDKLSDFIVAIKEIKDKLIDTLTGDWIGDPLGIKPKLKYIDDFIEMLEEIKPYIDDAKKVYDSIKSDNSINEEDEASNDTSSSSSGGGGHKWETGLTRGKANQIGNTVWSSGASSYKNLNRGPANPL